MSRRSAAAQGPPSAGTARFGRLFPVLAVVVLCSCLPADMQVPESPLLRHLERKSGLIAYTGTDGNIHVMDQAGGGNRDVTKDGSPQGDSESSSRLYMYPVWSPDNRAVAFTELSKGSDGSQSYGIYVAREGKPPRLLFRSRMQIPRLVSWAPGSDRLVFLANGREGGRLVLYALDLRGGALHELDSGTLFAWSWSPDSSELLIHAGAAAAGQAELSGQARLAYLAMGENTVEEGLPLDPGTFGAPAWFPDGKAVVVAIRSGPAAEAALYQVNRDGTGGRTLALVDGPVTFAVSPDGRTVAYLPRIPEAGSAAGRLYVVNVASGSPPVPASGQDWVVGFFWSPDSSRIAYFVPAVAAKGGLGRIGSPGSGFRLTLKVLTVRTGRVREVATFSPSDFFFGMVRLSDQFGQAARLWSPDSRFIVYISVDDSGPSVMVAHARNAIRPRKVADGSAASWSWR